MQPDPDSLNLHKFAGSAEDADAGQTVIIRRSAESTAAKAPAESDAFEAEFGLPKARMLGIVAYCYAKGFFRSDDIARAIREEDALREAFGRKLPDGAAIRTFRRRYSDELEDVLESAYREQSSEEGQTRILHKKAADTVHTAAWTDNTRR